MRNASARVAALASRMRGHRLLDRRPQDHRLLPVSEWIRYRL